jgi:hypothetical protein
MSLMSERLKAAFRWLEDLRERKAVLHSPEAAYRVDVSGDVLSCHAPDGSNSSVHFTEIARVMVETNDSGSWGIDVWWVIQKGSSGEDVVFPLGATGEDQAMALLRELPGFQIKGMNSTLNGRFLCWPPA